MVEYFASTKMSNKLLENNFKIPCYAGPPSSPLFRTHTTTVWIHRTTWWIIPASTNLGIKILENNFKIPCYARVSPLVVYLQPQFLHIWHIWSPDENVPPRWISRTMRMQPGGRSTSNPMFIRVSPLLVYLHPQFFHIWHFYSPVVIRSTSLSFFPLPSAPC